MFLDALGAILGWLVFAYLVFGARDRIRSDWARLRPRLAGLRPAKGRYSAGRGDL